MSRYDLSVVIPVYNEEKRVQKTLEEAFVYLRVKKINAEIIVVDDGSKDKTIEVVGRFKKMSTAKHNLKILKHKVNQGKGAAVRTGALAAQGHVVLYMDADNATPLRSMKSSNMTSKKASMSSSAAARWTANK